jgi:hypothetical protein
MLIFGNIFFVAPTFTFDLEQNDNPNKLMLCPQPDRNTTIDFGFEGRTGKWNDCWGAYRIEFLEELQGTLIEAEWKFGKYVGPANITTKDGAKFSGKISENSRSNGFGVLTLPSGYKYAGNWVDGKREGFGQEWYEDRFFFKGIFKNNLALRGGLEKENPNKLDQCNKSENIVNWNNCWGIYSNLSDQVELRGEWKKGKLDGLGVEKNLKSSEEYVGEFREGKFNGYGVLTKLYFDESAKIIYFGEWEKGLRHGKGVFQETTLYGKEFRGNFNAGVLDGWGREFSGDVLLYEGEYKNFEYDGYGMRYKEPVAMGQFKSGQLNGIGITFAKSGQRINQGRWVQSTKDFLLIPLKEEKLVEEFEVSIQDLKKKLPKIVRIENTMFNSIQEVDQQRAKCLSKNKISACLSSAVSNPTDFYCGNNNIDNTLNPDCYFVDRSSITFALDVKNNSSLTIYDVTIQCDQIGKSGTVLSTEKKTWFDVWSQNEIKKIKNIRLYKHTQMNSINCSVSNWRVK